MSTVLSIYSSPFMYSNSIQRLNLVESVGYCVSVSQYLVPHHGFQNILQQPSRRGAFQYKFPYKDESLQFQSLCDLNSVFVVLISLSRLALRLKSLRLKSASVAFRFKCTKMVFQQRFAIQPRQPIVRQTATIFLEVFMCNQRNFIPGHKYEILLPRKYAENFLVIFFFAHDSVPTHTTNSPNGTENLPFVSYCLFNGTNSPIMQICVKLCTYLFRLVRSVYEVSLFGTLGCTCARVRFVRTLVLKDLKG